MKKQGFLAVGVFLAVLAACLGGSVMAAPADNDGPVANAKATASQIDWQPKVEYSKIVLTVSTPDGKVIRKEFKEAAAPSFRSTDEKGGNRPDGSYQYELRVDPVFAPGVRETLAAARKNGNDEAVLRDLQSRGLLPKQELVQSGAFSIAGGVIVMGGDGEESQKTGSTNKPGQEGDVLASTSQFRSFTGLLRPVSSPFLKTSPYARPRSASRGAVVTPSVHALATSAAVRFFDQVIPDDLIVQGSLCVGFDCVNNESFGFDTIRLKENNTRIKFEDTSVGTFPTTDWQLTANDSASGGASKFSIEDVTNARVPFTVTAAAPSNSIFVDSLGHVGLRTSTPLLDIHVTTSNTPAMRLEQTSAGGFTAQTWDVAGNEANFFVRDITSGSRLPFRIRPGAPTSSIDIAASGNVGIGTGSPARKLEVAGTSNVGIRINDTSISSSFFLYLRNSNGMQSGRQFGIFDEDAGADRLVINNTGQIGIGGLLTPTNPLEHANGAKLTAGGVWMDASSRALKMNIRSLSSSEALNTLQKLNPVKFQYKSQPGENYVGFIAEDVPELVAAGDRKSLSSMDVVAVLTRVLQEQQKTIAELKEKVTRLETRKARVVRVKNRR
jgi:hypothetical protein